MKAVWGFCLGLSLGLWLSLSCSLAQQPPVFNPCIQVSNQSNPSVTSCPPLLTLTPSLPNAIGIQNSSIGTTGQITATLAAATTGAKWNYLCGFVITSGGTTSAITQTATITGVGSTMNFTYAFVSSGQGILGVAFPSCIAASATNTAIVLTVPGGGAGTAIAASIWGYQL